jgi:hypothetical protein
MYMSSPSTHQQPPHSLGHVLVSPLAHVPYPRRDHPFVDIALRTGLETALGRLAPWADGVSVTLRFTTATAMGMVI